MPAGPLQRRVSLAKWRRKAASKKLLTQIPHFLKNGIEK
jgi:hypothetical protein